MNILSYVPKLTFSSDPFCTDAVKVLILVVVGEVVVIGGDGGDGGGGGDDDGGGCSGGDNIARRYRDWDFQLITFKGHDMKPIPRGQIRKGTDEGGGRWSTGNVARRQVVAILAVAVQLAVLILHVQWQYQQC